VHAQALILRVLVYLCVQCAVGGLEVRHTVTGTLALLHSNHPEDCMS
jgi:hypothetical protein